LAARRSRHAWESSDNDQLDDAILSPNRARSQIEVEQADPPKAVEPRKKPKHPGIFTQGTTVRNDGIGGLFMMR
jgi:hypothetical protein